MSNCIPYNYCTPCYNYPIYYINNPIPNIGSQTNNAIDDKLDNLMNKMDKLIDVVEQNNSIIQQYYFQSTIMPVPNQNTIMPQSNGGRDSNDVLTGAFTLNSLQSGILESWNPNTGQGIIKSLGGDQLKIAPSIL